MTTKELRQLLADVPDDAPVPWPAAMHALASALSASGCPASVVERYNEPTILIERSDGRLVHIDTEGIQEYRDRDEYTYDTGSYGNYVPFRADD